MEITWLICTLYFTFPQVTGKSGTLDVSFSTFQTQHSSLSCFLLGYLAHMGYRSPLFGVARGKGRSSDVCSQKVTSQLVTWVKNKLLSSWFSPTNLLS